MGTSHWLEALGKEARREKIAKVIARTEGNIARAAHQMGVHRSMLYHYIRDDALWGIVNAARERRVEDILKRRALDRHSKAWEVRRRHRWFFGRKKGQIGKK